jgi:Ca2+-binding RTX toxin-like protein
MIGNGIKPIVRLALLGGLALILAGAAWGLAASNSVPNAQMSDTLALSAISPDDLAPPECAGMGLVDIVVGADGNSSNNLILGGAGADNLSGKGGDDCIVGGGGDDTLSGGNGNDVLLGDAGDDDLTGRKNDDTLYGGSGTDVCTGGPGPGTDTYDPSCETQN